MRLLVDSHILIALARRDIADRYPALNAALASPEHVLFASAASFWEIAIKTRLGRLDPGVALGDLARYFEVVGFHLLPVDHRHAVAFAEPEPPTRDPFDRMLLAQCAIEDLRLVTRDRALARHPLAWRA
jgi:PIN domain nuclease of toxin-antitoxin system